MNAEAVRRIVVVAVTACGLLSALLVIGPTLMMSAPSCLAGWWHGYGCYDLEYGVVLVALAGLPPAALAAWALVRIRHAAGSVAPVRTTLAEVGLVLGTAPFVWLTMQPGADAGLAPGRVSLIPLRDMETMGRVGIVGNLLILAAVGYFAPIRFAAAASVPRMLALGAGCSILIETAQYGLRLDRVSSVDDVLLNAAGAGLAALASRPWWRTTAAAPAPDSGHGHARPGRWSAAGGGRGRHRRRRRGAGPAPAHR